MQRKPRCARNQDLLHCRWPAADMLDQQPFIGAQKPPFAAPTTDEPADSAAVDVARVWTKSAVRATGAYAWSLTRMSHGNPRWIERGSRVDFGPICSHGRRF
jgi:hypothetical protein